MRNPEYPGDKRSQFLYRHSIRIETEMERSEIGVFELEEQLQSEYFGRGGEGKNLGSGFDFLQYENETGDGER